MPGEAQYVWENDLKEEIFLANAALRNQTKEFSVANLKPQSIRDGASQLGIPEERAIRIATAAQVNIDWHDAILGMELRGLDAEYAAEVMDEIVVRTRAITTSRDWPYQERRQRAELTYSLLALGVLAAVGGLCAYFWTPITSATASALACIV